MTPRTDGERHTNPVWLNGVVYYLSERDFANNIWSFDPKTNQEKQITFHADFDVKNIEEIIQKSEAYKKREDYKFIIGLTFLIASIIIVVGFIYNKVTSSHLAKLEKAQKELIQSNIEFAKVVLE